MSTDPERAAWNADQDREAWLAERRLGIGASDVAKAATGRYGGATAVVAEKLGIEVGRPISPELADRGHRWEQPIADGVHAHYGLFVAGEQMSMRHPVEPRWRCTVDGLLLPAPSAPLSEVVAGLEIKTRGPSAPWAWDYWLAQCQWSMLVTARPRWLLAIATIDEDWDLSTANLTEVVSGVSYRWVDVDQAEGERLAYLARWLWEHVERGELPEPTDAGALPYVKAANATADVEAPAPNIDDLAELVERRERLQVAMREAEAEARTIEAQLRHRLGQATEAATSDGRWRVRCGQPVRRFTAQSEADFLHLYGDQAEAEGLVVRALDRDRAKAAMPDEYDALRLATPDRRLTVKDLKAA